MKMLFDRVAKIVVGKPGEGGIAVQDLRIAFSVSKTGSKNPNNSDVRIWNLSKETRSRLEQPDTRMVIYAGYREEDGPIKMFEGDVEYTWTKRDGADLVTTFELGEGVKELRDTMISRAYQRGATSQQMMRDIAGEMGLGLDLGLDIPERRWENGVSFHGPARTAMDRVTRPDGLSWSIQNGSVQVVRTGGATRRTAPVLSAGSGLIGSPERMREGPREAARVRDEDTRQQRRVSSATDAYDGWRVRALLRPTIVPNDTVVLRSEFAEGNFVVRELRHLGDTHEGDWLTEMTLVDSATARRLQDQDREQQSRRRS